MDTSDTSMQIFFYYNIVYKNYATYVIDTLLY